jgi:O-antigen/teichoic acid export membrane protein
MHANLIYFMVRFGNGLLAIATLAIFSRVLTPEQYGKYALLIATATVLASLSFQWLSASIGRFYPKYCNESADVLRVVSRWFWLSTLGLSLLSLIALAFHKEVGIKPINIALIYLITVALGRYMIDLQIANSQHAHIRYCLLSWTKLSVALVASVIFIYFGAGEQGALLGFLVGLGFSIWVSGPYQKRLMTTGPVDKILSLDMRRYGLPLVLNFIAIVLLDFVDRFMIARLLGVSYVGPYSISYDFIQLTIGTFLNIFFLSAFPAIVQLFEIKNYKAMNNQLHELGLRLISFGLPLTVGLCILSGDISSLIFGQEYQHNVGRLLPWLAAAIFIAVLKSYCLDVFFQLHRLTKFQSYIAIAMVIVNIILNLILLPRYGLIGAGWATLAAFSLGSVMSWFFVKELFYFQNFTDVFCKSSISCLFMGLVLYFVSPADDYIFLTIKIFIAVLTYSLLALAFNLADSRRIACRFVGWLAG